MVRRPPRTKLRDVARSLGVSIATVSNAFNRPDQLSEPLRVHILKRAEELGYRGPGAEGRLLRTGHAGAIALYQREPLGYAMTDPHAVAFLDGVASACQDRQIGLLLLPAIPRERGEGGRLPAAIDVAAVDGFILYCLVDGDPAIARVLDRARPVVGVDMNAAEGLVTVGMDDRGAAYTVMQHLLHLSSPLNSEDARAVGIISLPLDLRRRDGSTTPDALNRAAFPVTRWRWQGYAAALTDADVELETVPLEVAAVNARDDGRQAAGRLLDRPNPPSLIAAMTDTLALGVLDACRERSLAVPEAVAIIGIDDIPAAETADLTTIRQDAFVKGRSAVDVLLSDDALDPVTLPYELAVRGTA